MATTRGPGAREVSDRLWQGCPAQKSGPVYFQFILHRIREVAEGRHDDLIQSVFPDLPLCPLRLGVIEGIILGASMDFESAAEEVRAPSPN